MRRLVSFLSFLMIFQFSLFVFSASADFYSADFEDKHLNNLLNSEGYYNGSDEAGSFKSGSLNFLNSYNKEWGSWSGFSLSRVKDTYTSGFENQYAVISGSGVGGSKTYAVAYAGVGDTNPKIVLDKPQVLSGFYLNNTTYAYFAIRDGNAFSSKFQHGDYFKLIIRGFDYWGNGRGKKEVYLADYRGFVDSILDYWKWIDLEDFGEIKSLTFSLESSDVGEWGMNTPAYFAIDNMGGPKLDESVYREGSNSSCFINSLFF